MPASGATRFSWQEHTQRYRKNVWISNAHFVSVRCRSSDVALIFTEWSLRMRFWITDSESPFLFSGTHIHDVYTQNLSSEHSHYFLLRFFQCSMDCNGLQSCGRSCKSLLLMNEHFFKIFLSKWTIYTRRILESFSYCRIVRTVRSLSILHSKETTILFISIWSSIFVQGAINNTKSLGTS